MNGQRWSARPLPVALLGALFVLADAEAVGYSIESVRLDYLAVTGTLTGVDNPRPRYIRVRAREAGAPDALVRIQAIMDDSANNE